MNRVTRTAVLFGWLTVFTVVGWIAFATPTESVWRHAAIGVALAIGVTDVCLQWVRDRNE